MIVVNTSELVNAASKEVFGETAVLHEDLSNVVDVGTNVIDMASDNQIDQLTKNLVNQVGLVVMKNMKYRGFAPSVLMDGTEYGSIILKISCADIPEAESDNAFKLTDGHAYTGDQTFHGQKIDVKMFNQKDEFRIPRSVYRRQLKQSFRSAQELESFMGMLAQNLQNAVFVKIDTLIQATVLNSIATTFNSEKIASGESGTKVIKLLTMYNKLHGTDLTPEKALLDPGYMRYATYVMKIVKDRLQRPSKLFNIGGKLRVTQADEFRCLMLSHFKHAAEVFLYDAEGQLKDENLKLPDADVVPYWQGSGTSLGLDLAYDDCSKVKVTPRNVDGSVGPVMEIDHVVCAMYDHSALGVYNEFKEVRVGAYNGDGDFYNTYNVYEGNHFNDPNENFVIFLNS